MELRHIEVFVAIAREKSFTKAAEVLGISQPTVSLHLQSLEKELRVKLFDREGKSISLTPAGKVFLEYAVEMVQLKQKAILALKRFLGSVEGTFTIGASTVPGEYILPRLLPEFLKQYPKTRFRIQVLDSSEIAARIAEGIFEMGVVGDRIEDDRLKYIDLCSDEVVVITYPDFPKDKISLEELTKVTLVFREAGSGTRRTFERALVEKGIDASSLNIVSEVGSTTAVKEAVKRGLGCGVVSKISVVEELERGELKILSVNGLKVERNFCAVVKAGRTLSPAIEIFIEFLKKQSKQLCV